MPRVNTAREHGPNCVPGPWVAGSSGRWRGVTLMRLIRDTVVVCYVMKAPSMTKSLRRGWLWLASQCSATEPSFAPDRKTFPSSNGLSIHVLRLSLYLEKNRHSFYPQFIHFHRTNESKNKTMILTIRNATHIT